jgi:hypothetical protein
MGKGKKNKKKDKSAAQAGQGQETHSAGGLKLPKQLRKAGSLAMDLAREPVVSEIVAGAMLSAAAALRDNKKAARAAGAAGAEAVGAAGEVSKQAGKIGDALRELAIDLARRTLDNWDRPPAAKAGKGREGKDDDGGPGG